MGNLYYYLNDLSSTTNRVAQFDSFAGCLISLNIGYPISSRKSFIKCAHYLGITHYVPNRTGQPMKCASPYQWILLCSTTTKLLCSNCYLVWLLQIISFSGKWLKASYYCHSYKFLHITNFKNNRMMLNCSINRFEDCEVTQMALKAFIRGAHHLLSPFSFSLISI